MSNNDIDTWPTYAFLDSFFQHPSLFAMDFRDLDCMGDTDESILDEPYHPFYNIFASKPVLVKQ